MIPTPKNPDAERLDFVIEDRTGVMVLDWKACGGEGCRPATEPEIAMWNRLRALEQTTQEGWQPIESAPRDGTHIILGYFDGHSEEGFWMGDAARNHWRETGWFATGDNVLCNHPCYPDAWIPLPVGPTEEIT